MGNFVTKRVAGAKVAEADPIPCKKRTVLQKPRKKKNKVGKPPPPKTMKQPARAAKK
jgi:hypothetical protein